MDNFRNEDYEKLKKNLNSYYILENYDYTPKTLSKPEIVYLIELFNFSGAELKDNEKKVNLDTIFNILNNKLELSVTKEEIKVMLKKRGQEKDDIYINFKDFVYLIDTLKREKRMSYNILGIINYIFLFIIICLLLAYLHFCEEI